METKYKPGELHLKAKLTKGNVDDIRQLYALGHKQKDIAEAAGVSVSLVNQIIKNKRWVVHLEKPSEDQVNYKELYLEAQKKLDAMRKILGD